MRYILFKFLLYVSLLSISLLFTHFLVSFLIEDISSHPIVKYLWQIPVYLLFYFYFKLFHDRMVTSNESYLVLKSNLLALITIFSIIFLSKEADNISRTYVLLFYLVNNSFPIIIFFLKRKMMKFSFLRESVIVICDEKGRQNIEHWFQKDNAFGFDVDHYTMIGGKQESVTTELKKILEHHPYQTAVIAIDNYSINRVFAYMEFLQHYVTRLIVLPRMTKLPLVNAEIFSSINHKGLAFALKNNLLNPVDRVMKNSFDVIVTTLLIILFLPLLLVLFIVVSVSTKGKPFFKHQRIGVDGKTFGVYKFKTMREDAAEVLEKLLKNDPKARAEWEKDFKLKNDPRITKIGKILRKTSLDELPQLINIIKGEMSLIGPRPIIEDEVKKYKEYYRYFIAVKPGITGLWQVSGRNDIDYDERVQLDVWYVRNWSIEMDITILVKTLVVVLSGKGSY